MAVLLAAPAPAQEAPALGHLRFMAAQGGSTVDGKAPVVGGPLFDGRVPPPPSIRPAKGQTGSIVVELFDGERRPLRPAPRAVLVQVFDRSLRRRFQGYAEGSRVAVKGLPVRGSAEEYTVVVDAAGWRKVGMRLRLAAGSEPAVPLMLLPERARFDFSRAGWDALPSAAPLLSGLLRRGADAEGSRARYEAALALPEVGAGLLNAAHAAALLDVGGRPALSYYRALDWREMSRSNFYAYVEAGFLAALRADVRRFRREKLPGVFHPGATVSFKQIEFPHANLQFTFYERDRKLVDGVETIRVETDMDLYRDQFPHFILEIVPAGGKRGQTDPRAIYQLRWMSARHAGSADFDPLYSLAED